MKNPLSTTLSNAPVAKAGPATDVATSGTTADTASRPSELLWPAAPPLVPPLPKQPALRPQHRE